MDPFDIQMHVSWYHAIDTKHVHNFVKFECRLSNSVLRNKPFFTKRRIEPSLWKTFVCLFSRELKGQPAFKFDKNMDVLCISCMILRTPGFLGRAHFFGKYPSNWSLFKLIVSFMDPFDIQMHILWCYATDTRHIHILVKFERRLSVQFARKKRNEKFSKGMRQPFFL
jgi:hypothetical protein